MQIIIIIIIILDKIKGHPVKLNKIKNIINTKPLQTPNKFVKFSKGTATVNKLSERVKGSR